MKKLLILFALISLAALGACSPNGESPSLGSSADGNAATVELVLPEIFFDEQSKQETLKEARAQGVEVTENADGSVTYLMKESDHQIMLAEMADDIQATISQMIGGDDSIFKSIQPNQNFSEIRIIADRAAYEEDIFISFSLFILYYQAAFYQMFEGHGEDSAVLISIYDENGALIDSLRYPEDDPSGS